MGSEGEVSREYEDISAPMRELINCDRWLREKFADQFKWAESLKKKDTHHAGGPSSTSGACET